MQHLGGVHVCKSFLISTVFFYFNKILYNQGPKTN